MIAPQSSSIFHLVPKVDPLCGLHAYASSLGGPLIVPDAHLQLPLNCRILLLHLSGYGYASNGAPSALVRQCGLWRAADPRRRLLVVFHELFARHPPWRKSFWWAPLQRRALRQLITCCDGGLSTLEIHSEWLCRNGLAPFATLPPPSNVGETSRPLLLTERDRQLVVFGGRSQRLVAYSALQRHPGLLGKLAIGSIHDIGPPLEKPPSHPQLPVYCHGVLSENGVAELMSKSMLAAVSYPLTFLAKSGIFAAICAHGALPLVLDPRSTAGAEANGLAAGLNFITPAWLQDQLAHPAALAAATPIAFAAWCWYQPHRLSQQRRVFEDWLAFSG